MKNLDFFLYIHSASMFGSTCSVSECYFLNTVKLEGNLSWDSSLDVDDSIDLLTWEKIDLF